MAEEAILYFDTSKIGAGVLMTTDGQQYRIVTLAEVRFGTPDGDKALLVLFGCAQHLPLVVGVAAEEPQGYDQAGHAIRRAQDKVIGELQCRARMAGFPWRGTIAPASAKKVLTGAGNADKTAMIRMANSIFGLALPDPEGEHQADAIGGAMASLGARYVHHRPQMTQKAQQAELLRRAQALKGGPDA
jgi:hypothetical protein